MANGLGLQLAADYGTIDKDTPSYDPTQGLDGTIIDGAKFLLNAEAAPVAIVIGSHESNYTEPFEVTSRISINVGLPQPIVQEMKRKFWLAVALAPYRSVGIWLSHSMVSKLYASGIQTRNEESWKLAKKNTEPDSNGRFVSSQSTQEHMDACWPAGASHLWTSNQLTTSLRNYTTSVTEGAHFCRTITVTQGGASSVTMDLPSIDCLMRVYQARQYIDSKDPTLKGLGASTYKDWNLTNWRFSNKQTDAQVWSSSPSGSGLAWCVRNDGYVNCDNYTHQLSNVYGVIPVLEIPVI